MPKGQLISLWETSSSDDRFRMFVTWVSSIVESENGARITSFTRHIPIHANDLFDIAYGVRDNPTMEVIMQVSVASTLFDNTSPSSRAVKVGELIIYNSRGIAPERADKEYQKQIDEWLKEMKKEKKKDELKAYAEIAKFFEKQFKYTEVGSL